MMRPAVCVVLSSLTLAACGATTKERGLSGAGIGASAGAVVGAVTGISVLQGALIGGAAGGLTGALTKEDQINLGAGLETGRDLLVDGEATAPLGEHIQRQL